MARQCGQTSLELRELVISHFRDGLSVRNIASIVKRSHSTVHDIIKRFRSRNNVENKPKLSKRKIFAESEERWIVRQIKKNPQLSAPKLATEAKKHLGKEANPETVRIILRKNNFNARVARKKPFVSKRNRSKRLQFAKLYKNKDFSFWRTVLYTDESKFNIFRSDGQTYVWRKPNEEYKENNLRPTVKHGGGSIMVWGCMSAAGPGNLHIIDGIMDQTKYLQILKNNLRDSVEKLGIADSYSFYQDNDPKHRAHNVRLWLLYNCPHVIETPAQSPDLNVIEHLWAYLEEKLKSHIISNAKDLEKALKDEWANIDPSYCEKLVRSMPNRLKAVRANKGLPTKY